MVTDESSKKLLEQALGVRFENNISYQEGTMMRKTVVLMVKDL